MRNILAAVLSGVLAAAVVHAQDACLTGASTLGDQRAFATLETSTESSCHCAAAATRRAWQRCAKAVLKTTLAGSMLRLECEKTAKQNLRGTSCGGQTLPCGGVPLSGDGGPACALKK